MSSRADRRSSTPPLTQIGARGVTSGAPLAVVRPMFIGPGNALEMTGVSWRWCRDFARRAGIAVLHVGGKSLIDAAQLTAAISRAAAAQAPARELTDAECLAALRAELGLELRQSGERE